MRIKFVMKNWAGVAMVVIGLCAVCITGCMKSPEKIAELTDRLFDAINSNDIEQAKLYIKAGANVNAKKGGNGITPLISAVSKQREEIVKLLIKYKANVNMPNGKGITPLMFAVSSYKEAEKRNSMATILIKAKANVNAKDDNGNTAFAYAVSKDGAKLSTVDLLIKSGADMGIVSDKILGVALILATCERNKEMAEFFIKSGANINEGERYNWWNPLMYASMGNYVDMANLLISAGADVNASDVYGYTVLMHAAMGNSADVAKLLIEAGANVNANFRGETALAMALQNNAKAVAEVLKAAGAR